MLGLARNRRWILGSAQVALILGAALLGLGAISDRLCLASMGCLMGDGTDVCVDTNENGIGCDSGDPNLTMNAPTNDAGDETVQGNLVVVGAITETGVTRMHETLLMWSLVDDVNPASGNCAFWYQDGLSSHYTTCGSSATIIEPPFKVQLTRFCVNVLETSNYDADDVFTFDLEDSAQSVLNAQLTVRDSGGTANDGGNGCVTATGIVLGTTKLQIQASSVAGSPAAGAIGDLMFTVWGYGVD